MLAIGFDPAFIDTLVRVQNKSGKLEDALPPPGFHHRSSTISKVAGGNGTNVAFVLNKLNVDNILVVPTNNEFEILLGKRGLTNFISINDRINDTVGITWKKGEIQFNCIRGDLRKSDWSPKIHQLWQNSPLHVYLNWGLNPSSSEWVSCQWLASCDWSYDELQSEKNVNAQALEEDNLKNPVILEPGSVKSHKDTNFLLNLLNQMGEIESELNHIILCCNEEENQEFTSFKFNTKIVHTSSAVQLFQGDDIVKYQVKSLKNEPLTYVGAGDAFLAGIIESLLKNKLDIDNGLDTAKKFLRGDFN